jgi:hypothetical protein
MKFIRWSGLLLSLTLVSVASCGQNSGLAKSLPDQDGYYPIDLGGQWTFELKEKNQIKTSVVTCDKTGIINKLDCVHLKSSENRLSCWVQKKGDVVNVVQTSRSLLGLANLVITFDPPIPILKFPLTKGDTWSYQGWGRTFFLSKPLHVSYENEGLETIQLDGKSYKAYRIEAKYQVGNDPAKVQISWYAQGLGFIHSHSDALEITLKKFVPSQIVENHKK